MKAKKAEKKDLVMAACGVIWGDGVSRIKKLPVKPGGRFAVLSKGQFMEEVDGPGWWKQTRYFPETSPERMSEAVA
jgi:hypothetical protein